MTVVEVAHDRLSKALEFKDEESGESDHQLIALEDYCLERNLQLDHCPLVKEKLWQPTEANAMCPCYLST
jgi:hypothetical protein